MNSLNPALEPFKLRAELIKMGLETKETILNIRTVKPYLNSSRTLVELLVWRDKWTVYTDWLDLTRLHSSMVLFEPHVEVCPGMRARDSEERAEVRQHCLDALEDAAGNTFHTAVGTFFCQWALTILAPIAESDLTEGERAIGISVTKRLDEVNAAIERYKSGKTNGQPTAKRGATGGHADEPPAKERRLTTDQTQVRDDGNLNGQAARSSGTPNVPTAAARMAQLEADAARTQAKIARLIQEENDRQQVASSLAATEAEIAQLNGRIAAAGTRNGGVPMPQNDGIPAISAPNNGTGELDKSLYTFQ
jgi:hypothetical protein